jgi:hypothetical protein
LLNTIEPKIILSLLAGVDAAPISIVHFLH